MDPARVRRSAALLFGLNYPGTPAQLHGCVNDVNDVAGFLRGSLGIQDIKVCTDAAGSATAQDCTMAGMVRNLYLLALRSWSERLDMVWLHYSGHGASVADQAAGRAAGGGDESDRKDEALCPTDFARSGLLLDDVVRELLAAFNPVTHIVFVVDACHSGTMGDLRFKWTPSTRAPTLERPASAAGVPSRVVMLSACRDWQTAADAWDAGQQRSEGALTSSLLDLLQEASARGPQDLASSLRDAFKLVQSVNARMQQRGYGAQVAELTSSHDMRSAPELLPAARQPQPSADAKAAVPYWLRVMRNAAPRRG